MHPSKKGILLFHMASITTADFRKGSFIVFRGEPHQIVDFQHVNPGKGSAFVRTKLKAIKTGRVLEFTYKSGESVEQVHVETREMQYLYSEGEQYLFMDNATYEQYSVPRAALGAFEQFLAPGEQCQIMVLEDEAVGVRPPKKVILEVTEAADGARGDTATGATKVVVVSSGARVTVPLFIKQGEKIVVDPETGNYVSRG